MKHASQQEDPPTGGNQILSGKLVLVRRTKKLINELKFWFSFFWTKRKNEKTAGFWFLLVSIIPRKQSSKTYLAPFNSDCELRLCRARFSQESLGMFNEVRGIPPRSYWRHLFNGENIINQWRKYRRCNRCSCPGAQTLSPPSQQLTTWVHHEYVLVHPN